MTLLNCPKFQQIHATSANKQLCSALNQEPPLSEHKHHLLYQKMKMGSIFRDTV